MSENVGIGEIAGLFEAFVSEPEDVEARFVAIDEAQVSGFVYLLILKHCGATAGERDNFKEANHDTKPKPVSNASFVAIIGVGPRPYDTHVWNTIQGAVGDVCYIGSDEHFQSWRDNCNPKMAQLGKNFDQGFRPLLRRLARHKKRKGVAG